MSLIVMAVHDTEENGRTEYTLKTLESLCYTLRTKPRLVVIDNNSCQKTKEVLRYWVDVGIIWKLITNETNVGTARAINQGIRLREPGEHVVKMDNDVVIYKKHWVEDLERAISKDPKIGIIGLKRTDLMETPYYPDFNFRSSLKMLPHEPGEPWIIVEVAKHIMGTSTMYSSALLDKIGYLTQPSVYGYDDSLACVRSRAAGFYNCFLPHILIDHIDPGGTEYTEWKKKEAALHAEEVSREMDKITKGEVSYYYDGN